MKKYICIAALLLVACTNPDGATRVLKENGFKDVQITGYKWLTCSEDDIYHTGFRAIGPVGTKVSGTVCEGLFFKNSTIRFD